MAAHSITEILAAMLADGEVGLDDNLGDLAEFLAAVRSKAIPDPDADFTHLILAAVEESTLTPIEAYARTNGARDRRAGALVRLAAGAAALLVAVTLSGGLAYAANGAKPGDFLYGLDRALEVIGIGDGGADERLRELLALEGDDGRAGVIAAAVIPPDAAETAPVLPGGDATTTLGLPEPFDEPEPGSATSSVPTDGADERAATGSTGTRGATEVGTDAPDPVGPPDEASEAAPGEDGPSTDPGDNQGDDTPVEPSDPPGHGADPPPSADDPPPSADDPPPSADEDDSNAGDEDDDQGEDDDDQGEDDDDQGEDEDD